MSRPKSIHRNAQRFPDGVVKIYARTLSGGVGDLPTRPEIIDGAVSGATLRCELRFREKKVGATRYYAALHEDILIDRVIVTLLNTSVSRLDVAVIGGTMYEIKQIQDTAGEYPETMDLSLERIDEV